MYRSFISATALVIATLASAQQYVHQVLVLNEGYYDFANAQQVVPVTLGSYDPFTQSYTTVATIEGMRFGNFVGVDENAIYVSADQKLLKYDADSYALLDEVTVPGIRRFAFWQDHIVITLGEVGGLPHYVEVRDKNTLDLLYSIDATVLPHSAEAVVVEGDVAYVGVNNGFEWGNAVGYVGLLDLTTGSWLGNVDLGPEGVNPENLMMSNGALYAFNNKDFMGSSVSRIILAGGGSLDFTENVAISSGCSGSAVIEDRLYYMEYAQNELARYDLATAAVLDTLVGSPATYGLLGDPINGLLYGTTTDFLTGGELHVMNTVGEVLSTVAVGVAPGKMALDVRSSTAMDEEAAFTLALYPVPATDLLTIGALSGTARSIEVVDATGRICLQAPAAQVAGNITLDVSDLAPGSYAVRVDGRVGGRFSKK